MNARKTEGCHPDTTRNEEMIEGWNASVALRIPENVFSVEND